MSRYVDYATEGTPIGRYLVLPGRQYTPEGKRIGYTLTAGRGTWDPASVSYRYAWLRDGTPISGAR